MPRWFRLKPGHSQTQFRPADGMPNDDTGRETQNKKKRTAHRMRQLPAFTEIARQRAEKVPLTQVKAMIAMVTIRFT